MSTMRGDVLREGHEGGEGQQFGIGRRAGTATMGRPGEEAQDTGGERNQDVRREREHRIAGSIPRQPLAVSDKWSNAQARMTMDQQSKVFDTDDDLQGDGSSNEGNNRNDMREDYIRELLQSNSESERRAGMATTVSSEEEVDDTSGDWTTASSEEEADDTGGDWEEEEESESTFDITDIAIDYWIEGSFDMLCWKFSRAEMFYMVEKDGENVQVQVTSIPLQQQENLEEEFTLFRSDGEILPVEVDADTRFALLCANYVPSGKVSDDELFDGSIEVFSVTNQQCIVDVVDYLAMASRRDTPTTTEAGREAHEVTSKEDVHTRGGKNKIEIEETAGTTVDIIAAAGEAGETKQEETLKERNRRLLLEEREKLSRRKNTMKPRRNRQKSKCATITDAKARTKEKVVATVENSDNGNGTVRVEDVFRRRESGRVDRRWELYLISKMKEKSATRSEKRGKHTARRTGWHPVRTARLNLSAKHKRWFDIQWNYDDASEQMAEREGTQRQA